MSSFWPCLEIGILAVFVVCTTAENDNSVLLRILEDLDHHKVHDWQPECTPGVSYSIQCYDCDCTPDGKPIHCQKTKCPIKSFVPRRNHRKKFDSSICSEAGKQLSCEECSCRTDSTVEMCRSIVCPPVKSDFVTEDRMMPVLRASEEEDSLVEEQGEWIEKCNRGVTDIMQCADCRCTNKKWNCKKLQCPVFVPFKSLEKYKPPVCNTGIYHHCEQCLCNGGMPEKCQPIVCPPGAELRPNKILRPIT